jgi:polar amino acid transport system substrate-binding protein
MPMFRQEGVVVKQLRTLMAACLAVACLVPVARAEDIVVYTEHYPPYNHENDKGEVVGLATKRVRQVLDAAGISYEIRLVPWSRAELYATTRDNTLIYSITRTPGREADYDWLVPLADTNFYLYARADEYRTFTTEGLRAGEFSAACVSGDLSCDVLDGLGIPSGNVTVISDSSTGDFRLVMAGRADVYVSNRAVNPQLRQSEGFHPHATKPVYRVGGGIGFYLAAGKQMPPRQRATIRQAYERLLETGQYQRVSDEEIRNPAER